MGKLPGERPPTAIGIEATKWFDAPEPEGEGELAEDGYDIEPAVIELTDWLLEHGIRWLEAPYRDHPRRLREVLGLLVYDDHTTTVALHWEDEDDWKAALLLAKRIRPDLARAPALSLVDEFRGSKTVLLGQLPLAHALELREETDAGVVQLVLGDDTIPV